ncbi:MAG: hypothetical protein P4L44_01715 [Oryzomonas sp.]|uniref:hypothetical protein n=1 Tax=Oryzomonas sp. TaxID=2855186 RepID=UPI0028428360|nr:hypothetical protein [Oryzomonas sp.]MDR3578660.1 hypothetical protein [Oryzomonas sp.]
MDSDFYVQIDFQKGTENPERVFQAMSDLIHTFRHIDQDLSSSIATTIQSKLILQDIEAGSIRARLRSILESIDDEGLKELNWKKVVGSYLVKGKYTILKFLEERDKIDNRQQIEDLRESLVNLAEEADIKKFPFYNPIPEARLIKDLQYLGNALAPLLDSDTVKFSGDSEIILINKGFMVSPDAMEDILTERVLTGQYEVFLKVKKPDYLGQSMWEFKHEGKLVPAKILDVMWVQKFQNKEIQLGPGDSIRALVEVKVNYDKYGDVISSHYTVLEVKEIIPLPKSVQQSLRLDF